MKKIIIGGLLAGVVIIIMGMIFGALSADMYKLSPKALWKPMGGDWFMKMIIFDFATGLILAYIFSIIKGSLLGTGLIKGVAFGIIIFVIGPLLGLTMTYLTMAVRNKLLAVWALNGLINYLIAGLIFEFIDEKIT